MSRRTRFRPQYPSPHRPGRWAGTTVPRLAAVTPADLEAGFAHIAGTCLLCGQDATLRGVFAPAHPQAWGAPPDTTRWFVYALCDACHARTDRSTAVELKLAAPMK